MTVGKEDEDIVEASGTLSQRVSDLIATVTIAQDQVRRVKRANKRIYGLAAVLALALIWVGTIGHNAQEAADKANGAAKKSQDAIIAIHNSQTINCQNANESREANVILWDTILISSSSQRNRTPEEKLRAEQFRTWVHDLYAQRDCSKLNKKYEIPDPPLGLTSR